MTLSPASLVQYVELVGTFSDEVFAPYAHTPVYWEKAPHEPLTVLFDGLPIGYVDYRPEDGGFAASTLEDTGVYHTPYFYSVVQFLLERSAGRTREPHTPLV